jgi:hypothetical protein
MDAQGFRTALLKPNFQNITIVNPFLSLGLKLVGGMITFSHPISLLFAPWLEFLSQRESHSPSYGYWTAGRRSPIEEGCVRG